MKFPRNMIRNLSQKLDFPSYVPAQLPCTTIQGFHELAIDMQKGLLSYSQEEITVAVPGGAITVRGMQLYIFLMRENRICIRGELHEICFLPESTG